MADVPVVEKPKRGAWRVNYYADNGTPQTALIVAFDGAEAAAFLGIVDSSGVQIVRDRYPVEVVGLDAAHAKITPIPVVIPPVQPPRDLSDAELTQLCALLKPQVAKEPEVPPSPPPFVAK